VADKPTVVVSKHLLETTAVFFSMRLGIWDRGLKRLNRDEDGIRLSAYSTSGL